jgi:acylphosphatase
MKRVVARAAGRVQGVGYRYHITGCAESAGISGTVQNLPDGTVEIIAEGEGPVLEGFLAQCRAEGDPYIRVDRFETRWEEPSGMFRSFTILR